MKRPELKPLQDEQIGVFLELIQGNPLEDLFRFALFTGMRISEITGLTWDCVDLDTGAVRVNKQYLRRPGTTEFYFESLKNDKERLITIMNITSVLVYANIRIKST